MRIKIVKEIPKLTLGEGLFWDSEYKKLWFVDIKSFMLYSFDIYTKELNSWKFNEEVCWVIPTFDEDKVIIGLKSGIAKFNIRSNKLSWIIKDFLDEKVRLNDVWVDNEERLWFGSMHNENESLAVGKFFSFYKKRLKVHDKNYKVTNGPVIIGKYLYHNDSYEGIIYRYEIDNGNLKNKEIFKKFASKEGKPDGMCLDEKGNILVAMWGSGKINRIDRNGNIIGSFKLPVPLVTNVCFGGENLDRLFVTSASIGVNDNLSGSLFEIEGLNLKGKKMKKVEI